MGTVHSIKHREFARYAALTDLITERDAEHQDKFQHWFLLEAGDSHF